MSVLAIVLIAIAAAFIGFIIGFIVGAVRDIDESISSTEPNPIITFNAEPTPAPAVTSKVVLPKRINELEYNKRVNAALKEVVDKAVDAWVGSTDEDHKRQIANQLYHEWHVKIENTNYRNYDPKLQCLCFVGRRVGSGFKFEAFWTEKTDDYDQAEQKETEEFDETWGFRPIDDDDGFRRMYKVTYDNKEASMTEEEFSEFVKAAKKLDLDYNVTRDKDAELAYYMIQLGFDDSPKKPTKDKPMVLYFYSKSAYLTDEQCAYMNWIISKVFDEVKDPPKMMISEYKGG